MVDAVPNPEIREAIEELQQYLSDTLPPLVVADSIKLLLDYPVGLVASHIHAWTSGQYHRGGADLPVSDYLFHAVKKIQLMGEFHMVPQEPIPKYLETLKVEVLNYCPEGDREFLKENLARLSDASASLTSSIEVLFRQGTPRERPLASESASGGAGGGGGGGGSADLASQTLAAAARSSQNARELDQVLDRLRALGLEVGTHDVFRSLGSSLPGWIQPVTAELKDGSAPVMPSPTVEAMRRVVTGAEDPAEGARRFNEMVKTAIERFNEGSLAQALTLLELAERIIAERQVDPVAADLVRRKADDGIDVERLRKYAEGTEQHPSLRRVLSFFTNLSPDGLYASL